MGYIDLRRRRRELEDARVARGPIVVPRRGKRRSGDRCVAAGLILGVPATVISYGFAGGPVSPVDALLFWVPAVAFLLYGVRRLRGTRSVGPGPGEEKQLLLALRDRGGITPVEAALETSLSVDEADRLLSRLAERGHLLVESRDGALRYALPGGARSGRRPGG